MNSIRCALGALAAVVIVAGCKPPPEPVAAEPASRPVKTLMIGGATSYGNREFPARVGAAQRVDLSFRLPGKLTKFPVREGQQVKAGDLIAELDNTQHRLEVDSKRALYERARQDYERGRNLVADGNISRMDFDRLTAQWRGTEASYNQARDDLAQTTLKAPFAGRVARTFVENFQEVQAKQAIASLTDVSELEIKVDLPQDLVMQLRSAQGPDAAPGAAAAKANVQVSFGTDRAKLYPLTFVESAAQADPTTQTFEVTFSLPAPSDVRILPGMAAAVTADLSAVLASSSAVYSVPVSAVVATEGRQAEVWVVDEAALTVAPRAVEVGALLGNSIEVKSGLMPGDRVVVTGTAFLREGMKVTLLPDAEQAAL